MAKSVVPLLLGVGVAAVVVMGGKKKKKKEVTSECGAFISQMDISANNTWLTNRYEQMRAAGERDLETIALTLLQEQDSHCPWGNRDKWTTFMSRLYDQMLAAVEGYYDLSGDRSEDEAQG